MSNIFSGIWNTLKGGTGGNWGTGVGNIANIGMGVLGTVGNAQAAAARNKVIKDYLRYQNYLRSLTPAQHAAGIQGFMRPLSGGLTSGVENLVQASMAERGLAQSPGIFAEVMAQALAPYIQGNQDRATQSWFQSLGLGRGDLGAAELYGQNRADTTSIWRGIIDSMFGPRSAAGTGSGGGSTGFTPGILTSDEWVDLIAGGGGGGGTSLAYGLGA